MSRSKSYETANKKVKLGTSSDSISTSTSYIQPVISSELMNQSQYKSMDSSSIISGLDDEYLLQPAFNINKFNTGSTMDNDDLDSLTSNESIRSYYSNINNYDIYDDVSHNYNYNYNYNQNYDYDYNNENNENGDEDAIEDEIYDKERERIELRMQFLKEMEI